MRSDELLVKLWKRACRFRLRCFSFKEKQMSFVIYEISTTLLYGGSLMHKHYESERSAKMVMTKASLDKTKWAIAETNLFHNKIEKQETRTNLMSGKKFTQPVNTPLCCDPSNETYWSM